MYVFTEAGSWKLREEGRRKMKQAIKSLLVFVVLMTDTDLGLCLYCLCSGEKHGTIIISIAPNHFLALIFQQEEEYQCILQSPEGKKLTK